MTKISNAFYFKEFIKCLGKKFDVRRLFAQQNLFQNNPLKIRSEIEFSSHIKAPDKVHAQINNSNISSPNYDNIMCYYDNFKKKEIDEKNASNDELNDSTGIILLSTIDTVPDFKIKKVLGLVDGSIVLTRNILVDYKMQIKGYFGGELESYTELQILGRKKCLDRMKFSAMQLKANAILGIRVNISSVTPFAVEFYMYGTAAEVFKN